MDRDLPGLEHVVNNLAILLGVVDRLIQNVVLGAVAFAIRHMAEVMRAGDELHASVFLVGIIHGQPHRSCLGRRQGPITGVLVPSYRLAVVRHLAKKVGSPGDHILAQ